MKTLQFGFILIIGLSAFLTSACSKSSTENIAGVKHFYYEFVDNVNSEYSGKLISYANTKFPQYDYFISEESAERGWPYFEKVERGTTILKNDMMPPHDHFNRLSPIKELTNYNEGEHTMKAVFTIDQPNENTISITKEGFEWKNSTWEKRITKITAEFKIEPNNKEAAFDKISKTLIRYTFK